MSAPRFVHLHLHTEYSLLDGANKIKDLAACLKDRGMDTVAISDHGNLFGAVDFYQSMQKAGIKPIIGLEAYLHESEELGDKTNKQRFHLCLFAKNEVGYKNLMYLSSQSYLEGFYYHPRINKKLLAEHSEGLICTSACLQGEVNWHLNTHTEKKRQLGAKGYEAAREAARWYRSVFGEDFYLEIMRHGIEEQRLIDTDILRISQELGIKVIATNDTHYNSRESAQAHEAFMCISTGSQLDDPKRLKHSVKEFYLKSPEEMLALFADIPEALENTAEIADKCTLDLELGNPTPPNFKFAREQAEAYGITLPEPDEAYSFENDSVLFRHLCRLGLEERFKIVDESEYPAYRERLALEMDIIDRMKFPGYMLIVWDFVREAKEQGVPVGPGRGSAAGSLVSYSLKITDIDPMRYGLLFERFLNPERISMPDIDMDFCQSRRDEVIEYVAQKYGRHNVAQVITFGSLLAKGVIRDVARVLGVPYSEADKMAKLIPEELGITLAKAYEKEPKIKELTGSDPVANRVWEFALQLEGLKRNAGTHAAGLVISNEPLWHKTPLYRPSGTQDVVTQYDGRFLEDVDLIKFDFLGLKTLTVIKNALDWIEIRHKKRINFSEMPMEDEAVFETIQTGHTLGLFQIESSGMQQLNAKMKPGSFEDLIAVLALYRPGPMESGMVDDFINRKHGREAITYMFDDLEPILAPTYGVIVYQEQVMQIVQTIGGFSLGKADLVRRAMGKKKFEEMERFRAEFAQGAAAQGHDEAKAVELFDLIEKFAGYGFNKSHSAAYAMITYQTAWLKTHYPAEFMAALLTSEADNTDKIASYIEEVKRMGIAFLPPAINQSGIDFTPLYNEDESAQILFGLGAIKGVGESALRTVLNVRKDAPFETLEDFAGRIDTQKVNKKVIEALIKSGALDHFSHTRRTLMSYIDTIVSSAQSATQIRKEAKSGLFGDEVEEMATVRLEINPMEEYPPKELLALEKESLGIYVSGHPLDDFKEALRGFSYTLTSELDELADGSEVLLVGKVEEIKEKFSKRGNKIGIITLMDWHGAMEVMLFERQLSTLLEMDQTRPIGFKAQVSKDDQFTRITVRRILTLEECAKEKVRKKLADVKPEAEASVPVITLAIDLESDEQRLEKLLALIRAHPGRHPVSLVIRAKLQDVYIETKLQAGEALREAARDLGAYELAA